MEGQRSGEDAAVLLQITARVKAISLSRLEGSWLNMKRGCGALCLCLALANVEYIVHADGMGDVERILDRIGAGMTTRRRLREVFAQRYNDVMHPQRNNLRATYGRLDRLRRHFAPSALNINVLPCTVAERYVVARRAAK